uniref:THAP-type domain-containing protein n=1 Tax=Heterorhabditis bacteriophora TaxID=37862 RepID=A0A1I7XJM7_HETBA
MNQRGNANQEIINDSHYVGIELGINVSSNETSTESVLSEELDHCGEEILCITEEPYQECDFENSEVVEGFMQGTDQSDPNIVDVVIPLCTNSGEVTNKTDSFGCANIPSKFSSNETDFEIVYSSLPPDINIESLVRATKSSVCGESLRVTKENGKFKIRTCDLANNGSSVYDCKRTFECVVCKRIIEAGEMFLNFPEDLDRRRIWGNMLGFKYNDMLRLKYNVVILSAGHICTDHFSEECFRTPWECTICSYRSHSVVDMQQHMLHHTDNGDDTMRVVRLDYY